MRLAATIATSIIIALTWCTTEAQPVAQWNETIHNFGSFHESRGDQSCSFVVTNNGDSALVIVRVQTTCGCTIAKYTTTPIMPGEKGKVDVTYSPTGRPGTFEKAVWVYTNTKPSRTRLKIEGAVVGSPQSVKQFFPVDAGDLQFTNLILPMGELRKGQIMSDPITTLSGIMLHCGAEASCSSVSLEKSSITLATTFTLILLGARLLLSGVAMSVT